MKEFDLNFSTYISKEISKFINYLFSIHIFVHTRLLLETHIKTKPKLKEFFFFFFICKDYSFTKFRIQIRQSLLSLTYSIQRNTSFRLRPPAKISYLGINLQKCVIQRIKHYLTLTTNDYLSFCLFEFFLSSIRDASL